MNTFKDHFSAQAEDYARYRPRYPAALFEFLADQSPGRRLAWDCATGNGQVAEGLAPHFDAVVATDASASQIAQAPRLANVSFRVEPAESSSLAEASVDLVTVGQALHWFDLDRFYAEVRRVARPQALVAAWCYSLLTCDTEVDRVLLHFYREVVGPYWTSDRVKVEGGYRDLPFPFEPVGAPSPAAGSHPRPTAVEPALPSAGAPERGAGAREAGATVEARRVPAENGAPSPAAGSHPRPTAVEPALPSAGAPVLALEAEWDLSELIGYLGTWSAAQRYRDACGADPRRAIAASLGAAWGSPGRKRRIEWPLHFRMGRA